MKSQIVITVEHAPDGIAEALFDFGIGEPDADGTEWVNMSGMDYKVLNYEVREILMKESIYDYCESIRDNLNKMLASESEPDSVAEVTRWLHDADKAVENAVNGFGC